MATLNFTEKQTIEVFLDMYSGYVLNFSNRTFQEFIYDAIRKDIDDPVYNFESCSKANRLRKFVEIEPDYVVGELLESFCDYWKATLKHKESEKENLYNECMKIAERLKKNQIVPNISTLKNTDSNDLDFSNLAELIEEEINQNKPEAALSRLHTYLCKYFRNLCQKHDIKYKKEETLNAVFGKYVKHIEDTKIIESPTTLRILKSSISILDSFNSDRNNRSYAHDNKLLNYNESLLIFNNISNLIDFINKIEKSFDDKKEKSFDDQLPF